MIDNDVHDNGDYDRVTAADIAEFLHHLARIRCGISGADPIDPVERAAFLSRKAALFTRIADQAERTRVDAYSQQVRQIARTAADQAQLQLPQQRVGSNQRRTSGAEPDRGGATSQEKSGASSG
jgi:hypothetical protein